MRVFRSSGEPEQHDESKTWTAGIDALRLYSGRENFEWHLHAIEFHHKNKEAAVALRDLVFALLPQLGSE